MLVVSAVMIEPLSVLELFVVISDKQGVTRNLDFSNMISMMVVS